MIKCVILDDELLAISYLKLLCEQIDNVEVVKAFNDPKIFLSEIEKIDCNVCILDIEMPGMNGLQVAETHFRFKENHLHNCLQRIRRRSI
ncbi:LytR/AlgR family response regulator transcription factor [Chryseobacterium ginsenosidimutans]|uniref:LytR/AlgR family response regulator transcription factor n=1 Tax=Chryseobacterium ginsenosidimutans TaxID=687846 RepID=UPI002169AE16|nr:response regulator [Chryseobacterium ginsenosidimutans]